ncbi:MAG TPA: DUF1425 domain-containing protein [Phycisphaerae bacterium]|nr:DUF1425 domain-containing protein [Phycisphaerales bacterium]HRX85922.1 DUF1425 domain-containing protein [Phycisphaerae bacterium]
MKQRMTYLGCSAVLAALTFNALACSHNPKAARQDQMAIEDYPQITALEHLDRVLVISDVVEDKGPPLKVTVALRDERDDKERRIQYRFFFFDERGVPENNNPDWRYKELPRRAAVYVDGNALDKNAVDWRLELRPAR